MSHILTYITQYNIVILIIGKTKPKLQYQIPLLGIANPLEKVCWCIHVSGSQLVQPQGPDFSLVISSRSTHELNYHTYNFMPQNVKNKQI